MLKKHLISCASVLALLIVVNLLIYRDAVNPLQVLRFNEQPSQSTQNDQKAKRTISFAHESIPVGDARVQWRLQRMLKAHSYDNLQTTQLHRKAAKWFPVMEPILKAYGIPRDFKYVPLVESGLKSGTSSKGASGFWQFMPGTARTYGLRVDGNVDERQMVAKSTVAACKYLRSLFSEFGSWTLVAAAYNIGENNLHRQINRQNQRNYFKMKLNRETATYIYKLVSMKEIIEHPRAHGYPAYAHGLLARSGTSKAKAAPAFSVVASNQVSVGLPLLDQSARL